MIEAAHILKCSGVANSPRRPLVGVFILEGLFEVNSCEFLENLLEFFLIVSRGGPALFVLRLLL